MRYDPPVSDMLFNLGEIFALNDLCALPAFDSTSPESIASILDQAARFAVDTVAPLNRIGDQTGTRLENDCVLTPPGWKTTYEAYAAGGWIGAAIDHELGGMGLPNVVGTCLQEILHGANMAFALCPMLSQAAIKAIGLCGNADQKRRYLPKLIAGDWTGTMVLTEPNAGSDLSGVGTRAERTGDRYLISGQKIFITYGDHDLTENIIHLVLARTAGPEAGTKGLSLFIVPKRTINTDGSVGASNDVRCVSLEHKLGIHGSPTALLSFGDTGACVGELIGEEGRGLEQMFVMMNEARLSVGIQGLAIAERAYQGALAYATERIQGRIAGDRGNARRSIRFHPDVHRMLMTMRSTCEAMRGLALYASQCMDLAESRGSDEDRRKLQARVELLVPIVKGWCTECACQIASIGVQVHGGMGYVEETGAAQHFRDARITTIYEGTTGIQANDLLGRKIQRDGGAAARDLLAEMRQIEGPLASQRGPEFAAIRASLTHAATCCEKALDFVLSEACDARLSGAVSVQLLHLFGISISGWILGRAALVAAGQLDEGTGDPEFLCGKIGSAHFFAGQVMPEVSGRLAMILDDTRSALALYPVLD